MQQRQLKHNFNITIRLRVVFTAVLFTLIVFSLPAFSSISKHNILVVENSNSALSMEIANYYCNAHNISVINRLKISAPTFYNTDYETYKNIETAVFDYIQKSGLAGQITCVLFMPDFPLEITTPNGFNSITSQFTAASITFGSNTKTEIIDNPLYKLEASSRLSGTRPIMTSVLLGLNSENIKKTIDNSFITRSDIAGNIFYYRSSQNSIKSNDLFDAKLLNDIGKPVKVVINNDKELKEDDKILGWFTGGTYSGVTRNMVRNTHFSPKSIAVLSQEFGGAYNNLTESRNNTMLPVAILLRKNISAIYTDIRNSTYSISPSDTAAYYMSGYNAIEAFYYNIPKLSTSDIVIGDPLTKIYDYAPVDVELTFNDKNKTDHFLQFDISAHAFPNTTVANVALYLDGVYLSDMYEYTSSIVTIDIGSNVVNAVLPQNISMTEALQYISTRINSNPGLKRKQILAIPNFEEGIITLRASDYRLLSPEEDIVTVSIKNAEEGAVKPRITIRSDNEWSSNQRYRERQANATLSFIGRSVTSENIITLNIMNEQFHFNVTNDETKLSDIINYFIENINNSEILQSESGVSAVAGTNNMPYMFLIANSSGVLGNSITYEISTNSDTLKIYPMGRQRLRGGMDADNLETNIYLRFGEQNYNDRYTLQLFELDGGYHTLSAIALSSHPTKATRSSSLDFIVGKDDEQIKIVDVSIDNYGRMIIETNSGENLFSIRKLLINGVPFTVEENDNYITINDISKNGAGTTVLQLEYSDKNGRVIRSEPKKIDIPRYFPIINEVTPWVVSLNGGTAIINGSGFTKTSTVTIGDQKVAAKFVNEHQLEIIIPTVDNAVQTEILVENEYLYSNRHSFIYYEPTANSISIYPEIDIISEGKSLAFKTKIIDQYNNILEKAIKFEINIAEGGDISEDGTFTAGHIPGQYTITATVDGTTAKSTIYIGAVDLKDGEIPLWLILGPYDDSNYTGLEHAYINEENVWPEHNQKIDDYVWHTVSAKNNRLDLESAFPNNFNNVIAYGHIYLYSPTEREAKLYYGSDDGISIFLNSSNLVIHRVRRSFITDENEININLKAGLNRLLVKVDQGTGSWCYGIKITDENGSPFNDLKYSLDPQ